MRCPSCGSKCRSNNTHCPRCAAPLDPKVAAFGGAARSVREAWGLDGRQETVVVPKRPVPRAVAVTLVALSVTAVVLVAVLVAQVTSNKPDERALDASTFGSEALVAVLSPYDTDGNGRLSATEAAAVTELDCSGLGLASLDGLDMLVNLAVLDASENLVETFDPAGLGRLTHVDLSNNALHDLSFAGSTHLVQLDVSNNGLTSLDVKGCSALERLVCPGNDIARLDLNGCDALVELACDEGQNVTLPLSAGFFADEGLRAAVASFDLDGDGALSERERTNATSLTVSEPATASLAGLAWFPNLTALTVSGTALQTLDAAVLPASLTSIVAENCALTAANLAGLGRLAQLDLSGNPLVSFDVSGCQRLTSLDLSGCALSGTLVLGPNARLESLDTSMNPKLTSIDVTETPLLQAEGAVVCDKTCSIVVNPATVEPVIQSEDPALEPVDTALVEPAPAPEPLEATEAPAA